MKNKTASQIIQEFMPPLCSAAGCCRGRHNRAEAILLIAKQLKKHGLLVVRKK